MTIVDEFIRFAKDNYYADITLDTTKAPDTFEAIIGLSDYVACDNCDRTRCTVCKLKKVD